MKQRHMFSLLDQTFTTVHVNIQGDKAIVPEKPRHVKRFEQGDLDPDALRGARWSPPEGQLRTYTYKVPKAWGIKEGDMLVVPRGVEHRPVAKPECSVLLVETAGVVNTGDGDETEQSTSGTWLD